MNKILSVSIAAYNVEKFLENTLESFICDPKTMDCFEIIIVNDGSKDNTVNIAKRYVEKYPNTFVLVDKENGGYGSTINASLKIANGKYFKLVDGDDWVNTNDFEKFVRFLMTIDSDMVISKYCLVSEVDGSRNVIAGNMTYDGQVRDIESLGDIEALPMHYLAFKTDILKTNGIRITEKCFYTDIEYILKPIPYIETYSSCDACVYMYRIGREGQSVSISSWQKNMDMALKVTFVLVDFWKKIENSETISEYKKKYIFRRVTDTVIGKYRIFITFPVSNKIKNRLVNYDNKIKEESMSIFNSCTKNKFVRLLRNSHFLLYKPLTVAYRWHLRRTHQI